MKYVRQSSRIGVSFQLNRSKKRYVTFLVNIIGGNAMAFIYWAEAYIL
jgi:hypothetical protein